MIPKSLEELNRIREECRVMATKRAMVSAAVAVVPIAGTDIAADIGLLMEVLPAISKKFGLSNDQIEQLDDATKVLIVQMAKKAGSEFVGRVITRKLIEQVLKKLSTRIAVKQVLKYVPMVGQLATAAIGFTAMKYVCNSHINECYEIVYKVLESQDAQSLQDEAAATLSAIDNDEVAQTSKQEIVETLKWYKVLLADGIIGEEEFQQKKKELISRL